MSEQRDHSVRRLVLTAVVLPIVLATIAAAWLAWQIARISEAADWIDSSDRVIAEVGQVQRIVVDQEMALRAFLYTNDPVLLDNYLAASPRDDLDELEQLLSGTADGRSAPLAPQTPGPPHPGRAGEPPEAAQVHALRERYEAFHHRADDALAHPAQGRTIAALRQRREAIDAVREVSADIIARAKGTRLFRLRRFERQTRGTTLGAVALLALLAGAASLSSFRQIRLIGALMARERDALAQAREALRAKDTFLANLSHELRTPLTPILWWASMARAGKLHGDALERALTSIERNARAEAQIVDDVLDISRIASQKLRIRRESVEPAEVVRAAVDVMLPSALAKGVTLVAHVASPLPRIQGDPIRLQQIVWNLLANAVKFTPRGGRVEVRADEHDGRVRVQVSDDGEGITADFLPHVFDDFRQADASATRAHGGLGLGLAIVKHLVALHGGEVAAESEGPGRGATFTVTLPAEAPAPAASAPAPAPAPHREV